MGKIFVGVLVVFILVGFGGRLAWKRLQSSQRAAAEKEALLAVPAVAPQPPVPAWPPPEQALAEFRLSPAVQPLPAALEKASRDCRTGIVVDLTQGDILWQKNPDEPVEIASMTKMMTAYLLMRAVYVEKRATLADVVPVSRTAAGIGGSQVWIAEGEHFTLEELSCCMMIRSANDATHLIAEHLAGGSADAFVAAMNEKAQQLGLTQMRFYNAHGLPPDKLRKQPENQGSARELAFLASRLLDYPDVVRWASTREDSLTHQKGKTLVTQYTNHNTLLGVCPGVNGMKTGYTAKSMYCTTVTCTRNGRTLIVVLTGCPRGRPFGALRDNLVRQFLEWAYAQTSAPPPPVVPGLPSAAAPAAPAPVRR
jgi:D-alanyl-D-alanine carboxypeptidase (penicillin-binding protein 5/6)